MFGCLGDQLAHTTCVMASQSMEFIQSQCYVSFWIWSNLNSNGMLIRNKTHRKICDFLIIHSAY